MSCGMTSFFILLTNLTCSSDQVARQCIEKCRLANARGTHESNRRGAANPGADPTESIRIKSIDGFNRNPGLNAAGTLDENIRVANEISLGENDHRHGSGFGAQCQITLQPRLFELFIARSDYKEDIYVSSYELYLIISTCTQSLE